MTVVNKYNVPVGIVTRKELLGMHIEHSLHRSHHGGGHEHDEKDKTHVVDNPLDGAHMDWLYQKVHLKHVWRMTRSSIRLFVCSRYTEGRYIYQPADLGIHTSVEYTFVVANGKNNISFLKLKQIQKFYFQVI